MWEVLKAPFNYGASGSKILVTSRNKKVADVMNSAHVHILKQLEDESCWKLFAKHAFSDLQNGIGPNLVSIGREIVKKCGGLPLAIKTLASLLRTKLTPKDWNKILGSDIWNLSENDSNIIPSLRLSYHYLPSNLKQCFTYCSIFPKDYEIDKDVLVQLWMAEGLLHSSSRGRSMQEVGIEFFNDLESRSFFEPSKNNKDYFVMHDLMNDLAKSVAGEFCLQLESDWAGDIPVKVRYLSYFGKGYANVQELPFSGCSQLRSFMLLGHCSSTFDYFLGRKGDIVDILLSRDTHFNLMRVLSMNRYDNVERLMNNIGNFKYLRYLDCSYSEIKELPSSICLMINSQTLKLKGCVDLTKLPSDLTKLINLYHLDLEDSGIQKMPKYMGKLNQLETMTKFVVGEKKGYDLKELGALDRLRGTLIISNLENVIDPWTATHAQMKDKHLDKLELRWKTIEKHEEGEREQERQERILEALEPNCDIKEVLVAGYGGRVFPDWFDGVCLPNIVSLNLSGCRFCINLPPLGQLPLLKKLEISKFNGVNVIGKEFYGNSSSCVPFFRSLSYLSFELMEEWEEWNIFDEEGESSFPCLEELYIFDCPKSRKSLPQHLPSLKTLRIVLCKNLESSVPKASKCRLKDDCAETEFLPQEQDGLLSTLLSLTILCCPKMITSCMDWDLHQHCSLEEITIGDEDVESFPEEGLLPPNVKSLKFKWCSKLRAINYKALLHLQSLQSIEIWHCPILSFENIPEVDGFPKSLSHLTIWGQCPLLEQRCRRERGQDWPKISHISLSL